VPAVILRRAHGGVTARAGIGVAPWVDAGSRGPSVPPYQSTRSPASHPRVAAGTSTGTSAPAAS
jgi:hypothetical protein